MDFLDTVDLDKDIDILYEFMGNEKQKEKHQREIELNKLRNDNHKRYYKINMIKLKNLPEDFQSNVDVITQLYKKLVKKDLLNEDEKSANESKKILDNIYRKISIINGMVKTTAKELEEDNDIKQSEFSIVDFKNANLDEKVKQRILNLYNELILYNAIMEKDIYENLKRQLVRKDYIDEIIKTINLANENKLNQDKKDKILELNDELNDVIDDTNGTIQYLSDLMVEGSEHTDSFNDFLNFYNKIIAYDDTNYNNVKQTLEILKDENKFGTYAKKFENDFIDERERILNEEKFVYEKVGLKNIKTSLDYISANYMEFLDKPRKLVIEDTYNRLDNKDIDINIISKNLYNIVKYIWENTITGIKNVDNFYILCSNSQFKEPKMEAILLSRDILNRMDNYLDYQIGFICNYSSNILYMTENEDIMSVTYEDLSKLKTPKQIEQEYINFNIVNKIALDGFMTKLIGVYYIDDGDKIKHNKALELSKQYNLPLIKLKKN